MPRFPISMRLRSLPVGTYEGSSVPAEGYGLCAYASNGPMPACFAAVRNVSGSTEARGVRGASFPFGPVTPQATWSPGRATPGVWTPS